MIEFEPEPYVRVTAISSDAARKFFGAPVDWPCEFDKFTERGIVWKLPTKGLTIK